MWNREDLKMRGKAVFMRRYWAVVGVALLLSIATASSGSDSSSAGNTMSNVTGDYSNSALYNLPGVGTVMTIREIPEIFRAGQAYGYDSVISAMSRGAVASVLSIIVIIGTIFGLAIKVFVYNPLEVGIQRFNMENRESAPGAQVLLWAMKSGQYMNIVKVMFLRDMFNFFWFLLFMIPGVIKAYEYRMMPYLLAENPGLSHREAFDHTKWMMSGQKMETFILDLSFLGWAILSIFTCGILSVFFVSPYRMTTNAELYAVLREHALRSGYLTTQTLPGFVLYPPNNYGGWQN